MDAYGRTGRDGTPVVADMCLECGGVWLDGAEVAKVYPGLESLRTMEPSRDADAGVAVCPRCEDLTTAFRFFEVILDHCPSCRGLWIDGAELADLARHRDREEGLEAVPAPETYRDNASRALRQALVVCKRCKVDVPLDAVENTREGPLCATCAKVLEREALDQELDDYEVPLRGIGGAAFLQSLGGVLDVALTALETRPRCKTCGCRHASRCSH